MEPIRVQLNKSKATLVVVLVAAFIALVVAWCASSLSSVQPQAPETDSVAVQAQPMLVSSDQEGDAQGDGTNEQDDERLGDVEQLAKEAAENAEETSDEDGDTYVDSDDNGGAGKGGMGKGGTGSGGGSGDGGDPTGEDTDAESNIITDLSTRTVEEDELDAEGLFDFYAYLDNYDGYTLKVKFRNDTTGTNGTDLTSSDEKHYATTLQLGENYVVLYLKRGTDTVQRLVYMLTYVAKQANEDEPTRGDNPPTISTNLDGTNCIVKNQHFILRVKARTADGAVIYSNHITVKVDGEELSKPTGTSTFEYDTHFDPPKKGDSEVHKVTVVAWDDQGNSRFVSYNVEYQYIAEGDKIGEMTIRVDLTTLGLGITDEFSCDILQGETLPHTVLNGLEEEGYTVKYGGSLDNGFYLSRLSRSKMAQGAKVPDILWSNIKNDGLNLTGQKSRDSVGEFDYTQGSGWMYCINSTEYPGRAMAAYYPDDGDVVSLRFTLAYGKDIGQLDSSGTYGDLAKYCGTWVEGAYTPDHDYSDATVIREPTCGAEGERTYTCPRCGTTVTEAIPALEHEWKQTDRVEPTATEDGYVEYTCTRCKETRRETLLATGEDESDRSNEHVKGEWRSDIQKTCSSSMCGTHICLCMSHALCKRRLCK